jgi:HPt (histidine-containing phosphotransfer) domain-containing protein
VQAAKTLDLDHLSAQAAGDKMLMQQVLDLFLDHAETVLEALALATEPKAWHDHAHALKGSAKGVGCWAVADAAFAAEQRPLDSATIPPLRAAFGEARAAIRAYQAC